MRVGYKVIASRGHSLREFQGFNRYKLSKTILIVYLYTIYIFHNVVSPRQDYKSDLYVAKQPTNILQATASHLHNDNNEENRSEINNQASGVCVCVWILINIKLKTL